MTHGGQSTGNSETFIYISNYIISLFKHVADGSDRAPRVVNGSGQHPPRVGCRLRRTREVGGARRMPTRVSVGGPILRRK